MQIDLNCDMGESFGAWVLGQDAALLPLVTSANIACGFHAGDPGVMARTVALAQAQGVALGAHPGYPDLQGFGRRALDLTAPELEAAVLYQIGALAAFAQAQGTRLRHVKPHGALYNRAAGDYALAAAIARAVHSFAPTLILVGLAGSRLLDAGRTLGLPVAAEAFADRAYEADGTLRARRLPGAILPDPAAAAAQALSIVQHGQVRAYDGTLVPVHADTLCIHGDTPGAPAYAQAVRSALEAAGITIAALPGPAIS
ncbi:MAG TPA: 5-oxoprolinase subunit PxpA [Chloroflexia bacterium]|nr:5-oxoprolinase subunit PxpA [Chloroflexia bacterium]